MAIDPTSIQKFVSLLTDHQETLRSYIISQLPGSPDVRDVLQEVNLTLWERRDDFELGTNFGAWACTTAYYKILDHRKRLKRNGFLVFNSDLCETLATEAESRKPADFDDKRRALKICLAGLSKANRRLLEARYGSPSSEMDRVAAETGRTRPSLRITLSRLRSLLRECIRRTLAVEGGRL